MNNTLNNNNNNVKLLNTPVKILPVPSLDKCEWKF